MTYYYDTTDLPGCIGILPDPGDKVVFAGTEVHMEPSRYRGALSDRFARECDFHFWFDDEFPAVNLYTVPKIQVGGYDSRGGLFACIDSFSVHRDTPMYYISASGSCFLIAPDGREFLERGMSWQKDLLPSDAIEIFSSKEEAKKKYNIRDLKDLKDLWEEKT